MIFLAGLQYTGISTVGVRMEPGSGFIHSLSRKSGKKSNVISALVRLVWTGNPAKPPLAGVSIAAMMGESRSKGVNDLS